MAFETLSLGLTLTLPTNGTRNWGTTIKNTTWTAISQHSHTGSGDGNKIGSGALEPNLGFTQQATATPTGTTQTIDWNSGNIAVVDLGSATGDVTLTLDNPTQGGYYTLISIQGATPRDFNYPANVKFAGAVKPIKSQTNDGVDYIHMYYDGTDYLVIAWDLDLS